MPQGPQISFPNRFRRFANYSVSDTSSDTKTSLKGKETLGHHANALHNREGQHSTTIGTLANELLLEVFDWYRQISVKRWNNTWRWTTLVHVCRSWRRIVLESPDHLDLWLLCTYGTPVRRMLDCCPPLPIFIKYWANFEFRPPSLKDEDNIIAALECPDRVRGIQLSVTSSQLEKVAERMQVRFPALTSLSLWLDQGTAPALSTAFLGGCASPRLRDVSLVGITFPKLSGQRLASASNLVSLQLLEVPSVGCTAPDVVATCLSTLPHLRVLSVNLHSPPPQSCGYSVDHQRSPIPMTRDSLPNSQDVSKLVEDLVARIDAPLLSQVNIMFSNQPKFDTPHLSRFIGQTEVLKSAMVADAETSPILNGLAMAVPLGSDPPRLAGNAAPGVLRITCRCPILDWLLDWQIAQICCHVSLFSNLENLDIRADYNLKEDGVMDVDSVAWLPLEYSHSYPSGPSRDSRSELGPHGNAPALEGGGVDKEIFREALSELRMISALENLRPLNTMSLPSSHQVSQHGVSSRGFPPVWDDTYM